MVMACIVAIKPSPAAGSARGGGNTARDLAIGMGEPVFSERQEDIIVGKVNQQVDIWLLGEGAEAELIKQGVQIINENMEGAMRDVMPEPYVVLLTTLLNDSMPPVEKKAPLVDGLNSRIDMPVPYVPLTLQPVVIGEGIEQKILDKLPVPRNPDKVQLTLRCHVHQVVEMLIEEMANRTVVGLHSSAFCGGGQGGPAVEEEEAPEQGDGEGAGAGGFGGFFKFSSKPSGQMEYGPGADDTAYFKQKQEQARRTTADFGCDSEAAMLGWPVLPPGDILRQRDEASSTAQHGSLKPCTMVEVNPLDLYDNPMPVHTQATSGRHHPLVVADDAPWLQITHPLKVPTTYTQTELHL
eukprot:gene1123-57_t